MNRSRRADLLLFGNSLKCLGDSQAAIEAAGWLRVDRVLGECGTTRDSAAGRREFERLVETRRGQEATLPTS
jgi:hypothetical protein